MEKRKVGRPSTGRAPLLNVRVAPDLVDFVKGLENKSGAVNEALRIYREIKEKSSN